MENDPCFVMLQPREGAPCTQTLLTEDDLKTVSLLEDPEDPSRKHPNFRKRKNRFHASPDTELSLAAEIVGYKSPKRLRNAPRWRFAN